MIKNIWLDRKPDVCKIISLDFNTNNKYLKYAKLFRHNNSLEKLNLNLILKLPMELNNIICEYFLDFKFDIEVIKYAYYGHNKYSISLPSNFFWFPFELSFFRTYNFFSEKSQTDFKQIITKNKLNKTILLSKITKDEYKLSINDEIKNHFLTYFLHCDQYQSLISLSNKKNFILYDAHALSRYRITYNNETSLSYNFLCGLPKKVNSLLKLNLHHIYDKKSKDIGL